MTLTFGPLTADGASEPQRLKQRVPNHPREAQMRVTGTIDTGNVTLQSAPEEDGTFAPVLGGENVDAAGERTVILTPGWWVRVVMASAGTESITVEVVQ